MRFQPSHPFVLALSLTAPALTAQDAIWPCFRGPLRTGVAASAKPPKKWSATENVRWKRALPGPGSSSPIVLGDRIYVTCYTGYGAHLDDDGDFKKLVHHLLCFDRKDGKILWQKGIPGPLEKAARRMVLSEHGFATPTPVTDGKHIYTYFGHAGVVAFDLEGEKVWQSDLGKPSKDAPKATNSVERNGQTLSLRWGSAASPLLFDNLVIVNASEQSNSIRALDKRTGELVWKRESSNLEGSAISPALASNGQEHVLVIALGGAVWGLAPRTGEPLWSVKTGTRGGMSPTPVADENHVYAFGGMGNSFALRFTKEVGTDGEGEKSRVAWKSENQDIPSPVLHDGKLWVVRTKGDAVCMQASDGKVLFKDRLEGRTGSVYASPVLADGRLYVVTRKRGTFVYTADEKLELLSRNELDDKSQFNASPALAGDELILRSDKFLYCISKT